MDVIGARLRDDVHRGTRGPAELGGERIRQDGDFLNGANRHRCQHRLPAPPLVVARAVEHECRRASAPGAGDEVRGVDEEVAGPFALTECRVEERQRGDLPAKDGRLVDRCAVETLADLGIGPDALGRAVDSDLRLRRSNGQPDLQGRRFASAKSDVVKPLVAEPLLRHKDSVGAGKGQCGDRRTAVAAGRHVPHGARLVVRDRHFCIRDDGARLIDDEDNDRRIVRRLGKHGRRAEHQRKYRAQGLHWLFNTGARRVPGSDRPTTLPFSYGFPGEIGMKRQRADPDGESPRSVRVPSGRRYY